MLSRRAVALPIAWQVRLERKQRNLAKLLAAVPGTRLVRLFKARRTDLVHISLAGAPGEPPLVCALGKGGLAERSKRLFVGDEVLAINGVPTLGHEATRLRLAAGIGVLALALATINVVGGFLVTGRMLAMFKKKER